ncbi:MAG: hypothetical protein LV479_03490 [Methylacidiphilales bacterium]|nr:hypothetical protein [Candidatus Methylacidiphilales bacterium]
MFRDLAMFALIGLGLALLLSNPLDWKGLTIAGPYVVQGMTYLVQAKPFSIIVLFALALALFMTRLKY